MSSGTSISALYSEFTDALTEVLAENAVGPARRKGSRRRQEASRLQRVWTSSGGRNCIQPLFKRCNLSVGIDDETISRGAKK